MSSYRAEYNVIRRPIKKCMLHRMLIIFLTSPGPILRPYGR